MLHILVTFLLIIRTKGPFVLVLESKKMGGRPFKHLIAFLFFIISQILPSLTLFPLITQTETFQIIKVVSNKDFPELKKV